MNELATVIAAVDDSAEARALFRVAKQFARPEAGGRAFAIHATGAVSSSVRAVLFPYACFGEDEDELGAELVRHAHEQVSARLGDELTDASALRVVDGDPRVSVAEALRSVDGDLVVVGSGAKAGASWLALGTTGALLRASATPVLVCRPDATEKINRILVGVDLSSSSRGILQVALEWAHRLGAQVQPVFVLPDVASLDHAGLFEPKGVGRSKKAVNQLWTQLESSLELRFPVEEELSKRMRPRIITSGDPATKLVELALEAETDLVVVGRSRGGSGSGAVLGRTAEHIVRRAPCSVLVVPNGTDDD